ncbi:MAG: type II toxin-antitoxin system VapC family toxin [Chlorobium phaeobacteroides]|uniref:PilT protein domain protein n=1 Tax=Chlorobium phaeobacteroides (strain BS1) TaxID=331678 RepID=B3ENN6_CHLPB|nr:type II toxin-antitoxin system VapC family toxin [Chlorobium phaeobacteroides]MBL6955653.1 type II toxin-antitoxin system VapC family toxin [Chlorobium phaeobacteroides]
MITVDTHVILWDALKPEMLSGKAKRALAEANRTDGIFFCSISLWEIAMLIRKKRIEISVPYRDFVDLLLSSNRYFFQEITPEIAYLSTTLPDTINGDPADRIIASSSLITKTSLITADENLRQSELLQTIW